MSDQKFWTKCTSWAGDSSPTPIFSSILCTFKGTVQKSCKYDLHTFQLCCTKIGSHESKYTDLTFRTLKPFVETFNSEKRFGFSIDTHDFFVNSESDLAIWLSYLRPMCILASLEEDFVLLREIGRGSTATVYLSNQLSTKAEFAVKCIKKTYFSSHKSALKHLKEEISILRLMSHECIMKLFYVYESEEFVYLVTEYLPKWNLCRVVREKGRIGEERARKIMRRLLETIGYMHSRGIVHRDLKLENLVMGKSEEEVKIIDFGLAFESSTKSSSKCGSPGYIAPEVIIGSSYDAKIDIFSAGVILYILLTGKHPFEGRTDLEILQNNINVLYKTDKKLTSQANSLIHSMMQPDPEFRPSASSALTHPWFLTPKETLSDQLTSI